MLDMVKVIRFDGYGSEITELHPLENGRTIDDVIRESLESHPYSLVSIGYVR